MTNERISHLIISSRTLSLVICLVRIEQENKHLYY